jgi:hypothetical protein
MTALGRILQFERIFRLKRTVEPNHSGAIIIPIHLVKTTALVNVN